MTDERPFRSLRSPTARELMEGGMVLEDGTRVYPSQNALERIESEIADLGHARVDASAIYLDWAITTRDIAESLLAANRALAELVAWGIDREEVDLHPDAVRINLSEARQNLRDASAALGALLGDMEASDLRDDPVRRALERLGDEGT